MWVIVSLATSRDHRKIDLEDQTHTGIFSCLSIKKKRQKGEDQGSKNEDPSSHSSPSELLSTLPPTSSTFLKSLEKCQDETAAHMQTQQKDFPPKELSSEQIQEIMRAKYLSMRGQETDLTQTTAALIDPRTLASIKTTPEFFKGLLLATRTDYIGALQDNQEVAKRIALEFLKSIDKMEDNIYNDIVVHKNITATRLELVTANNYGSTATAEIEKGNTIRGIVYNYLLMLGGRELKLPFLNNKGVLTFLEGKAAFSFTEQLPQ